MIDPRNEYLAFLEDEVGYDAIAVKYDLNPGFEMFDRRPGYHRKELCLKYSWAIPNREAIRTIADLGPIIEMGAGTGYWASLVTAAGADVIAYDINLPGTSTAPRPAWHSASSPWFPVQFGGVEVVHGHSDRALMLCWPPHGDPFAADCVRRYEGSTVIYIGETVSGSTADDDFYDLLDKEWDRITEVVIPQYDGTHDDLTVWARKP